MKKTFVILGFETERKDDEHIVTLIVLGAWLRLTFDVAERAS